ncbi:subtilase family domain-containing protein [Rhizoctonia solani AG-1 IA]|uniref:Subtilase family domain-containing protein n=1 Tax=Thanatephorus cucumeris (strain AG1-IA) TaxID=983506 RepID=L8WVR2_THACA|nr:subtilase family domain-containing protein [Rhizoctonia solani AG-1 IA]
MIIVPLLSLVLLAWSSNGLALPSVPFSGFKSTSQSFIVKLKPGHSCQSHFSRIKGSLNKVESSRAVHFDPRIFNGYAINLDDQATFKSLSLLDSVEYIEPDTEFYVTSLATQTDAPWGLHAITRSVSLQVLWLSLQTSLRAFDSSRRFRFPPHFSIQESFPDIDTIPFRFSTTRALGKVDDRLTNRVKRLTSEETFLVMVGFEVPARSSAEADRELTQLVKVPTLQVRKDPTVARSVRARYAGANHNMIGTAAGTRFGVAKQARVIDVKVITDTGRGFQHSLVIQITDQTVLSIAGLSWAAAHANSTGRPSVFNLSLGGGTSTALDDAVMGVVNAGIHTIVAAGNADVDASGWSPARVPGVIAVGNVDINGVRSETSNYGSPVAVFAPGVVSNQSATTLLSAPQFHRGNNCQQNITSAGINGPNSSRVDSGTSMAAATAIIMTIIRLGGAYCLSHRVRRTAHPVRDENPPAGACAGECPVEYSVIMYGQVPNYESCGAITTTDTIRVERRHGVVIGSRIRVHTLQTLVWLSFPFSLCIRSAFGVVGTEVKIAELDRKEFNRLGIVSTRSDRKAKIHVTLSAARHTGYKDPCYCPNDHRAPTERSADSGNLGKHAPIQLAIAAITPWAYSNTA